VFELVCQECRVYSDAKATGWRGYRVDDPEENEPPVLAFYCPACAESEFDAGADSLFYDREES
jgi:hypothetical protein